MASHRKVPPVSVMDFDATDTPVHGKQEGRLFHGLLRLPLFAAAVCVLW